MGRRKQLELEFIPVPPIRVHRLGAQQNPVEEDLLHMPSGRSLGIRPAAAAPLFVALEEEIKFFFHRVSRRRKTINIPSNNNWLFSWWALLARTPSLAPSAHRPHTEGACLRQVGPVVWREVFWGTRWVTHSANYIHTNPRRGPRSCHIVWPAEVKIGPAEEVVKRGEKSNGD